MSQDLVGMRCKHYSVKHACVLYQVLGNMTLQHMQIFAFAKVVGVTYCVHAETIMNFTCMPKIAANQL